MIIKDKISFGDGKALYELVASAYDSFPYKRNHTLPEDAVSGTVLSVTDINSDFVYISVAEFDGDIETWVRKGASSDNVGLIPYQSGTSVLTINNPADADAIKTAIATAYTVKLLKADRSIGSLEYGSTAGTNYQIDLPNPSTSAGDYYAIMVFRKVNPTQGRAKPDSFNCPTLSIGESVQFGGTGMAASKAVTTAYGYGSAVFAVIPYKVTANREETDGDNR